MGAGVAEQEVLINLITTNIRWSLFIYSKNEQWLTVRVDDLTFTVLVNSMVITTIRIGMRMFYSFTAIKIPTVYCFEPSMFVPTDTCCFWIP